MIQAYYMLVGLTMQIFEKFKENANFFEIVRQLGCIKSTIIFKINSEAY